MKWFRFGSLARRNLKSSTRRRNQHELTLTDFVYEHFHAHPKPDADNVPWYTFIAESSEELNGRASLRCTWCQAGFELA